MVAEGVETGAALTLLRDHHCDLAQGYHLSRPLPAAEVTSWLRRHPTRRVGELTDSAPNVTNGS